MIKCEKCGKKCKGNRGIAIHQIHCKGKGARKVQENVLIPIKKQRRMKKITLRDLQEQITAIETRIEIAVKILMGV